jgi:hypothetical protein
MVLSVLGLLCCFPLSIVSFFLARADLKDMDEGRMDPSGRSITNAARIVAIVAIVLGILQWVWVAFNWGSFTSELTTGS